MQLPCSSSAVNDGGNRQTISVVAEKARGAVKSIGISSRIAASRWGHKATTFNLNRHSAFEWAVIGAVSSQRISIFRNNSKNQILYCDNRYDVQRTNND